MKKSRKIKLFVDAHSFDKEYQGTRTFIREMYNVLIQKDDLQIYMGAYDVDNLKANFPFSQKIVFIKYKSSNKIWRLLIDIPIIILKYKIDYAHFQYIVPPIKCCKFIVTIHDVIFNNYPKEFPFFYRFTKNILCKWAAYQSQIITTVSNYSKESIRLFLNVKTKEIIVTPNGVSEIFFKPYDKRESKIWVKNKFKLHNYILYVSRLEPRKNHILVLKSYLDLKLYEKNYYLVLIGHKSIKIPEFESLLRELPEFIRSYIYFHSKIDDHDLLYLYKGADVFVYPSKAEGFGIPPLEAAALKIPVICSNTSALADYNFFGDGHINPNDVEGFKIKLCKLLFDDPQDKYLEQVSNLVFEKYNWKQSAEILYQSILKNYIYHNK